MQQMVRLVCLRLTLKLLIDIQRAKSVLYVGIVTDHSFPFKKAIDLVFTCHLKINSPPF